MMSVENSTECLFIYCSVLCMCPPFLYSCRRVISKLFFPFYCPILSFIPLSRWNSSHEHDVAKEQWRTSECYIILTIFSRPSSAQLHKCPKLTGVHTPAFAYSCSRFVSDCYVWQSCLLDWSAQTRVRALERIDFSLQSLYDNTDLYVCMYVIHVLHTY
jgi:hypothetical protein